MFCCFLYKFYQVSAKIVGYFVVKWARYKEVKHNAETAKIMFLIDWKYKHIRRFDFVKGTW